MHCYKQHRCTIIITSIGQNDDPSWSAPSVGTKFENGQSFTIVMGNASAIPFVRGLGFSLEFLDLTSTVIGGIYLNDPAVGAHHFSYTNPQSFQYVPANPNANNYTVKINPAA